MAGCPLNTSSGYSYESPLILWFRVKNRCQEFVGEEVVRIQVSIGSQIQKLRQSLSQTGSDKVRQIRVEGIRFGPSHLDVTDISGQAIENLDIKKKGIMKLGLHPRLPCKVLLQTGATYSSTSQTY